MAPGDAAYVVVLHATRLVPFEHWKPTSHGSHFGLVGCCSITVRSNPVAVGYFPAGQFEHIAEPDGVFSLAQDLHDVAPFSSWFSPSRHGAHSSIRPGEGLEVPNVQLKQKLVAEALWNVPAGHGIDSVASRVGT